MPRITAGDVAAAVATVAFTYVMVILLAMI
jgi:hypothetical protein